MKLDFKRISCILLLICILALSVFASDYIDWELSDDGRTLMADDTVYNRYYTSHSFYEWADNVYEFLDYVNHPGGFFADVSSYAKDNEFVWISDDDGLIIFVKEGCDGVLEDFFSGEKVSYRMIDTQNRETNMDSDFVNAVFAGTETLNTDVTKLVAYPCYEISAHDEKCCFAYDIGAIYELPDGYYSLDFRTLGNEHFDSDGFFSYRSGSVDLVKVDAALTYEIEKSISSLDYRDTEYMWESEDAVYIEEPEEDDGFSAGRFRAVCIFFGIVLPLAVMIFGAVMANSKKLGKPKYWYSVTVAAGIWLLLSVVLALLLI